MGHIKEPKGVDFIIKSEPITEREQAAISEYIKNYKLKHSKKKKLRLENPQEPVLVRKLLHNKLPSRCKSIYIGHLWTCCQPPAALKRKKKI